MLFTFSTRAGERHSRNQTITDEIRSHLNHLNLNVEEYDGVEGYECNVHFLDEYKSEEQKKVLSRALEVEFDTKHKKLCFKLSNDKSITLKFPTKREYSIFRAEIQGFNPSLKFESQVVGKGGGPNSFCST